MTAFFGCAVPCSGSASPSDSPRESSSPSVTASASPMGACLLPLAFAQGRCSPADQGLLATCIGDLACCQPDHICMPGLMFFLPEFCSGGLSGSLGCVSLRLGNSVRQGIPAAGLRLQYPLLPGRCKHLLPAQSQRALRPPGCHRHQVCAVLPLPCLAAWSAHGVGNLVY